MTIYENPTLYEKYKRNREISKTVNGMLPKDCTITVTIMAAALWVTFGVLFVNWWLV